MTHFSALSFGFDQARSGLLRVVDIARLHLSPSVLTRSIAVKAKRHLKALEACVRRLILLRALQIEARLQPDWGSPSAPPPRRYCAKPPHETPEQVRGCVSSGDRLRVSGPDPEPPCDLSRAAPESPAQAGGRMSAQDAEHIYKLDMRPYIPQYREHKPRKRRHCFRFLESIRAPGDFPDLWRYEPRPPAPVSAAPFISRVQTLQAILDAPESFARRLALRLARQKDDQCPALPDIYTSVSVLGTEAACLHHALAQPLFSALTNRPPRAGPRPRPPPRIRTL